MAPRPRHKRRGQPQGRRPEQRLADDLKRHQLAHEVIPELVESAERFLDTYPRIARRRTVDRILQLSRLASDVLAWTALGAPRDEHQLPARCFAASCFLDNDPHRMSWVALTISGIGAEVRAYVREFASTASERPTTWPTLPGGEPGSALDEVREMAERLRAREATSADGLRLGRRLILGAIALDPVLSEEGWVSDTTAAGAFSVLEGALLADGIEDGVRLLAPLEAMADAMPHLIEHAAEHLEEAENEDEDGGGEFGDDHDEDGPEQEQDDEDDVVPLDDALGALDARLMVTDQASDGAMVAFQAACLFLIYCVRKLHWLPPTFEARVQAAGDTLMSPDSTEDGEDGEDGALVQLACEQAAALLAAEVPSRPREDDPVEEQLAELDGQLADVRELAVSDLDDGLLGALTLVGATTQVLHVGLRLGHEDADIQRLMAAALGVLDPLALADFPELRAGAAETLREHARSTVRPGPRT